MISPLVDQKSHLVGIKISIDGSDITDKVNIALIEVEKNVNKLPYARFEFLDGDPSAQKMEYMDQHNFKPGQEVKIEAGYERDLDVIFEGIISQVGYESQLKNYGRTQIECSDKCVTLTLTKDNEYFENMKDSEIASKILQDNNLECKATATKTKHKKIVQYNTSDWDFLLSRAKACERVVVVDANKYNFVKPGTGAKKIEITYGQDIIDFNLDVDARNQRKKIEIKAWDASNHEFKTGSSEEPSSIDKQGKSDDVKGTKLSEALSFKDETLYAPSQLETSELKDIANSKLLHSRLARIKGKILTQGIATLEIDSYVELKKVHKFYEGDVYVAGLKHTLEEGNFITEIKVGLETDSFDPENTTGSTPDNLGLMPGPKGLFIGEVTKMDGDPDNDFRVQVKIPSFKEDDPGLWAKLSGPSASQDSGIIWYPEVGDQVIVGFIMNDPRFPVILGSLYSKTHAAFDDHKPTAGNNQKAIVTREHMKLLFEEDKKDITLTTPGENYLKIMDSEKKIHIEDEHGNKIIMDREGITIDSPKKITIKAGQEIDMDAIRSFTAKGSTMMLEGKSGAATLKAAAKVKIDGSLADVNASGMVKVSGQLIKLN